MAEIIGNPDELVAAVQHESRRTARDIVEDAEKKAERILLDAGKQTDEESERLVAGARARAEKRRKDRAIERTRAEKESYLKARKEMMEEVWHRAEKRLDGIVEDPEAYVAVLERLAVNAAEVMGPGRRVLVSDPAGHALLTDDRLREWAEKAGKRLDGTVTFRRAEEPADISGGLIVEDEGGRRRINAAFSTRLAAAKEEISHRVMERLVRDE